MFTDNLSAALMEAVTSAFQNFEQRYGRVPNQETIQAIVDDRLTNSMERLVGQAISQMLHEKIQINAPEIVDNIFLAWINKGDFYVGDIPEATRKFLSDEMDRLAENSVSNAPERLMIQIFRADKSGKSLEEVAAVLKISEKKVKSLLSAAKKRAVVVRQQNQDWFGE